MSVGIICEYNPFHNGHLYHLQEIKKRYPNDPIILVLGGPFLQRGESSILSKWDKTEIALEMGIDLVVELPYPFASQSADIFAKGSLQILQALKVDTLVFGSECGDISLLTKQAKIQLQNSYQTTVGKLMEEGINYPTALSRSLELLGGTKIEKPNDILGISYVREILKNQYPITPITIKRTNDYHDKSIEKNIVSASAIRSSLQKFEGISHTVPSFVLPFLEKKLFFIEDYFPYLKYKIMSEINYLNRYQTVEEGIENRIKKYIISSESLEQLVNLIKTKRYTYNKIMRMLTHILCGFTKEEAKHHTDITYLRILGFTKKGRLYLNNKKKEISIPIITNYSNDSDHLLDLDFRISTIYASILPEKEKKQFIEEEYKRKPIM